MSKYELLRDITAADLAIVAFDQSLEWEGYAPTDVIGPKGTTVTQTAESIHDGDDAFGSVEVTGFANDPYAIGFIDLTDVRKVT